MAAYSEIIEGHLPLIHSELHEYVLGVMASSGEDMCNTEDIYEAVGLVLREVDPRKSEEDVFNICDELYRVLKRGQPGSDQGPMKVLDGPVHLGSITGNRTEKYVGESIWLTRKDTGTTVDRKKLQKAEAKIKQKQDRRAEIDSPITTVILETASASQQTNRKDDKLEASGTNRSYDIRIENFDVAFGELSLILNADVLMSYGRRYGLVGRNGIGKTTLLRSLSSGSLRIPSHISVLHVEQEVVGDDTLALQSVLESDEIRESLMKEEKEINQKLNECGNRSDSLLSSRLAEVYHELESIEADKAPSKAASILYGLGFSPEGQKRPTRQFSGGWRMRLALARALFAQPDLLLLDEPTNMLDMKAILWLENYLQTWPSTILVVSHDRSFLNAVVTDIFYLHSQKIDSYKGDFEMFVKIKADRLKNQIKEYEAQKQYRDHIQIFIDRFRYNANRASQVQSKLKLLAKLPALTPVAKETEPVLRLAECSILSPPVLQLDEVDFCYEKDAYIFKNVSVSADQDSRICIVGENGAGKTTLLKILLGKIDPVKGIRHAHKSLRLGYFSQHHVDQLDMNQTCVEVMASQNPGHTSEGYRRQLGSFGVTGELAVRPVCSLSGGQKSRVAFAVMSCKTPNFLILDEPTNHLDMETIEALGKALQVFQGGVILVSHDERLIRMICKELWVCGNQTVKSLEGGFNEYKTLIEKELASQG